MLWLVKWLWYFVVHGKKLVPENNHSGNWKCIGPYKHMYKKGAACFTWDWCQIHMTYERKCSCGISERKNVVLHDTCVE